MKIVMLPGINVSEAVFKPEQLDRLRSMGTLIMRQSSGPTTLAQAAELLKGADVAITSWMCPSFQREVLDTAPDLKLIVHAAGTVKGIVTDEVISRGIRVSSGNEPLGVGVAETALGLTITGIKHMWQLAASCRLGLWDNSNPRIRELFEVTVGVVGAGKSGRHYIRLLKQFDVNVLVYDPLLTSEEAAVLGVVKTDFESLLACSDVISIHAPALPETKYMFNKHAFALMKDDAVLINTARGSIVHEDDLVYELQKGRFTACLDVTDPEPPAEGHPFRTLPNIILLPHIAGAVHNGKHRIGKFAVDEVFRFQNGLPLAGEVNLESLHVIA